VCLTRGDWRRFTGIPKRGSPGSTSVHKMEILNQLGELFLQAVPTVIIVFLFFLFLRANFFKPIERILAERSARVEGARNEASAAQAAAQEKLNAYEEALKKARAGIYAEQEAARQAVLDERAKLIRATREDAQRTIRAAKERIEADMAAARIELQKQTPETANEIARVILEQHRPPASPGAVS
jgi:F-type H+-transporting ATPase subunit b